MSEITGQEGGPFQKLSKLDAAGRQLATAIRLFFAEEDAVPIHTIVAAAHGVLEDLLKKKGGKSYIKNGITIFIHPEDIESYKKQIREPQNFLKHADRDPEGTLEFSPNMVSMWIFDCLKMYGEITGTMFPEGSLFSIWFVFAHPEFVLHGEFPPELERIAKSFEPTNEFCLELLGRDDLHKLPHIIFHIPEEK